jgi:hypothetical protein
VGGKTREIERQRTLYLLVVREKHGIGAHAGNAFELLPIFRHDEAYLMAFFHEVYRNIAGVRPAAGADDRKMVDHQDSHHTPILSVNSLHASITCSYSLI